ncbi:MAG: sulfite oxidase subunit YedZ [Gammaproteobacteria bacterium]|nr:MAG: sulfite oxidase subunit YedZ [Gammaproteobacteria bacterium]
MQGWQRVVLWAVLLTPLLIQTYRYLSGSEFYGEYLHWTGDGSVWLLLIVLAITPLRRFLRSAFWTSWLVKARRDLGISTAVYALAHTVAYLARKADLERVLADAAEVGMLVGWLALVGMLVLAATSNDRAVRSLGGHWKSVHRWIYPIALLSVGHWVLTAFDPTVAYANLAVVILLLLVRIRTSA